MTSPTDFRSALESIYRLNPCQVLPGPLWQTLAHLDEFTTSYTTSAGQISLLEAAGPDSLAVYWRPDERRPSYLLRRRLEYLKFVSIHQDFLDPDTVAGFPGRQAHFRLIHDLSNVLPSVLPAGFSFRPAVPHAEAEIIAAHITRTYEDLGPPPAAVQEWASRPAFAPDLWLWLVEGSTDRTIGLAIGSLDPAVPEATLDWLAVLPEYRGQGHGRALVAEVLHRVQGRAAFITATGPVTAANRDQPGAFFQSCGFAGRDIWWLLTR